MSIVRKTFSVFFRNLQSTFWYYGIQASSEEVSSQIPVSFLRIPYPKFLVTGSYTIVLIEQRQWHLLFWNNSQEENIPYLVLEFFLKTCDFWEQHYEPIKAIMFNHQLFGSDFMRYAFNFRFNFFDITVHICNPRYSGSRGIWVGDYNVKKAWAMGRSCININNINLD